MKNLSQSFGALRLLAGFVVAQATLTGTVQAANRIVSWGDINYDVVATAAPAFSRGPGVLQISSGDFHSVALGGDGNVLAWGDNRFGQTIIPE